MQNSLLETYTLQRWMSATSALDVLSLGQLILPGAHNAGVDKKATYAAPGLAHWVACQNNSFYTQMLNGARVLDVRIEYEVDSRGVGTFWFQHSGYRSSRSMENLILQVIRFLQENPDEFVLLDFHELKAGNTPFDHKEFSRLMLTHLGERIIPAGHLHLSLGQLKELSRVQRVWVATEPNAHLDRDIFLAKIQHEWSGIADTNVSQLHAHIERVLRTPPSGLLPWSLSATSYNLVLGPVNIKGNLDRWFDPVNGKLISKCSVINADFFEESRLVANCRTANIIKAQLIHR
jgi:1-phosphatidylinositol phosphodiesterase